ncbi:MAG TPA: hypothetical protein VMW34_01140 [Anaerolineales bacterium]|jgi:hypothetical protein|nr:hypothetical protein [Anaerolineales bacterium]
MLPHNIIRADFERQNRNRIQQEAENSRLLRSISKKDAPERKFPAWKFKLSKFRVFRLRDNPAS